MTARSTFRVFCVLGAVCLGWTAAPAGELTDLCVGAADGIARIEIVTSDRTPLTRLEGTDDLAFWAPGLVLAAPMRLEAGPAGGPVRLIELRPEDGGASVRIAALPPETVSVRVSGGPGGSGRAVIDLAYAPAAAAQGPRPSRSAAAPQTPAATATAAATTPKPGASRPAPRAETQPKSKLAAPPARAAQATGSPTVLAPAPQGPGPKPAAPPSPPTLAQPPAAAGGKLSLAAASDPEPPVRPISVQEASARAMDADLTREACSAAKSKVAEDAWDMEALVDFGLCRAAEGDAPGAEDVFRRLLTFDPYSYRAHLGLAALAEASGERGEALASYRAALEAEPPEDAAARIEAAIAELGG